MIRSRSKFWCRLLALGAWCVAAVAVRAEADGGDRLSLRVRIEWGGGEAKRWTASAQVQCGKDEGKCSAASPLGVEADEPGSMGIAEDRWFVEPRSPRLYDGVDLTVEGHPLSELVLDFLDVKTGTPTRHKIPFEQLLDGDYHAPLDETGNRLAVRRAPDDKLRVEFDRSSLVFDCGETFSFRITPHLLRHSTPAKFQLVTSLRPARQSKVLSSDTVELDGGEPYSSLTTIEKSLRLPEEEGVYDIVLELSRRELGGRLRLNAAVERRTVQVIVLAKTTPPRDPETARAGSEGALLQEIDPASPGIWNRMKSATVPAALRRGPLGNVQPTIRTMIDASYVELPPPRESYEPSWQAYPLSIARPGEPHWIEVEYPANVAQSLGVSLVEPNAVGSVMPIGLDMGLYVDESEVESTAARRTQRFLVWPKTAAPLLTLVNLHRRGPAVYGKIRVLGPRSPATYRPWLTAASPHLDPLPQPDAAPGGRLFAASFARPLFPDNFGATGARDEETGRSLDDWVTFYDGAQRLIEYLKHCGYNGLQMTVAADGGAIYPSDVLQPTPRYDDGAFFSTGQDPVRKDIVELLLRLCNREGLRFVPAIQFTAPLARLEDERRRGISVPAPLSADGRAWNELHPPEGGLGPHYNPLHPRVRLEMKAAVAEFLERYGHHSSLAGLAIPLTAEGYTQLPGVEWGFDAETLAAFHHTIDRPEPKADEITIAATNVLQQHRDAWIAWRQQVLTQFYHELAEATAADSANRKLYLSTAHAWQRPDLQQRLQPTLPLRPQYEPLLREAGLDPAALAALPGVEYLRGYRESPLDAPAEEAVNLELNRDVALDRRHSDGLPPRRGVDIFNEPQSHRLPSMEKQSPFQPAHVQLVTQAAATGAAARRPFVHALAVHDAATIFAGGWLLPLGTHEETRRLATVIRSLPSESFTTLTDGTSPVIVRELKLDNRVYIYLINDAPWPTTFKLNIDCGKGDKWHSFVAEDRLRRVSSTEDWQALLEPYDVVGGYFEGSDGPPSVKITNPQAVTAPEVAARLQTQVKRLWGSAAALSHGPNRFDDRQRLELTKLISSAEYRLQQGDVAECARMLGGYWPRYLTAYAPIGTGDAALVTKQPSPPSQQVEKPAAREASRRWWPSFLRDR